MAVVAALVVAGQALRIVNRAAFVAWLERGAFGDGRKDEKDDAELGEEEREGEEDGHAEEAGEILDALGLHEAAKGKKRSGRG